MPGPVNDLQAFFRRLWNSKKLRLLHPAAHPLLVVQVLLAEGAFQVTLLALDHLALDDVHHQRQQEDGPQRVTKKGDPGVDHDEGKVSGVAAETEGSFGD